MFCARLCNFQIPRFLSSSAEKLYFRFLINFIKLCVSLIRSRLCCAQFCISHVSLKFGKPRNKFGGKINVSSIKVREQTLRKGQAFWLHHSLLFNYPENCRTYREIVLKIKRVSFSLYSLRSGGAITRDSRTTRKNSGIYSRNVFVTAIRFETRT